MNDTTNPSLIERLLDALSITGSAKTACSIIIALGVILICGFLMTRLTKLLRLPNATAYIVTGILIGPSVINLIPRDFISNTDFISDIALVFIAFTAGEFFKIKEIKSSIGKVLIITAIEAIASFALVFALCAFVFSLPVPLSLLLAALSSATAPTSTIMTIKQTKSKGHYVNMLLQVIVVDSIISLLLYTISISICVGMNQSSGGEGLQFIDVAWPIAKMLICLVIGVAFGFALRFLISSKRTTDNRLIVVIAVLLLFCGICSLFGQSPLLGGIAIGLVYTNLSKGEEKLFAQVNYFIPPIMLIFFVRGGMNLDFSNFGKQSSLTPVPLIVIVLGFLVARFIGKLGGCFLGSLAARQPKDTRGCFHERQFISRLRHRRGARLRGQGPLAQLSERRLCRRRDPRRPLQHRPARRAHGRRRSERNPGARGRAPGQRSGALRRLAALGAARDQSGRPREIPEKHPAAGLLPPDRRPAAAHHPRAGRGLPL